MELAPPRVRRRKSRSVLALVTTIGLVLGSTTLPASSQEDPPVPPEVDPGTPTYSGDELPVPPEPVAFDPTKNMLREIYEADLAAGSDSFWVDRILERPAGGNGGNALYTKGRALYMYTHNPGILGFAGQGLGANQGGGGFGYREPISFGVTHLYTVDIAGETLAEDTGQRTQSPSHWSSIHTSDGISVRQRKFITHNNVAVTLLTLTNTGGTPADWTVTASTPSAVTQESSSDGTERTGMFNTRYNLTTVRTRFSGNGFNVAGNDLVREVTVAPGEEVTLKVQLGAIADEIADSDDEYERYRSYSSETAFRTHLAEYNEWWADNVPYIDVPDDNIKKMSYYRTFLNRFNYFDASIPGNDFQFPVSVEGALGYNNAIQLTQPMHMQDLKYFRDPLWSYGNWVSSGETSKCDAFIDNPGSHSWGNTYEQYIAREAWNAYKVHGGDRAIIRQFAKYAECDVEGQLNKYDSNNNNLIEYNVGFLTGNDADTPTFHWAQFRGEPTRQDRAEAAFQYAGAKAAAEAYALLGRDDKAAEMEALAEDIREAILTILWDEAPVGELPEPRPLPATRSPGQAGFGNAIQLGQPEPNRFVDMPDGILAGINDFTIATWVNRTTTSGQTWSRIFDFGTGTQVNMFLTPNAGGPAGARFAITTNGGGAEEQVTADDEIPTGWHHVAVTRSGTTVTLWVDGVAVATNENVTLSPSDLGDTTNNWIGRSQYPDPYLDATVDDFQIYDHALDAEEVERLAGGTPGAGDVASYSFDEDSGATAFDSSGNGLDATIVSPPINVIEPEGLTGFWEAPHLFKRRNLYYLAYARGHPLTGGNPATIDYATATNPLGPWTHRGTILGTVNNTTTNHPAIVNHRGGWFITYHTGMLEGGGEFRRSVSIERLHFNHDGTIRPVEQSLSKEARRPIALFPFDRSQGPLVSDTSGHGWDGTAVNDPERVPGRSGNAMGLNGADQYVSLPQGIVWNMYDFTAATWVKLADRRPGQRVFDFGNGPDVGMYLTPESDSGTVRFGIKTNAFNERQIDGTAPLPVGEWVHVAITKSGLAATLYVNGVAVGEVTNLQHYPARLGNTPNNWIGRSQNEADPFLNGAMDDFRIYQYGLSPEQIRGLATGPGP